MACVGLQSNSQILAGVQTRKRREWGPWDRAGQAVNEISFWGRTEGSRSEPRTEPGNEVRCDSASRVHSLLGWNLLSTYCIPGFKPMILLNAPDKGGS